MFATVACVINSFWTAHRNSAHARAPARPRRATFAEWRDCSPTSFGAPTHLSATCAKIPVPTRSTRQTTCPKLVLARPSASYRQSWAFIT
eukprot:6190495-Pleurochrysis_carterae.AAC.9